MSYTSTLRYLLGALFIFASCAPSDLGPRQSLLPAGKGDSSGSCRAGEAANHCGGRSTDGCWCDDTCRLFGNCCSDKVSVCDGDSPVVGPSAALRFTTYNLEDVRTEALADPDDERLKTLAAVIQAIRPDVILINEIAYDHPAGANARRFVDNFLAVAQRPGLRPIAYDAKMFPSNTGVLSGFDLNNDGTVANEQTTNERAYGGDSWGFGAFAGQYAFALLVRPFIDIQADEARTFANLRWNAMPDALLPIDPETGEPWYDDEEWGEFRLSSKNHVDVPIKLPTGQVIHCLISHPTPPVFDGAEKRNQRRNHDEIRFWGDYLDNADYLVDDNGQSGGLPAEAHFVFMGDLNSDPDEGASLNDPVGRFIIANPLVAGSFVPEASAQDDPVVDLSHLDLDDTSQFGARIDYVLPSATMTIRAGGVVRPLWIEASEATDHFPVWLDVDFTQP